MDKFISLIATTVLLVTGTSSVSFIGAKIASTTTETTTVATTTISVRDGIVAHIDKTFPEDKRLMRKIAECESGLVPTAKSKTSSASGIFQIISGTWKHFSCEGDPFNYIDNINCARNIYESVGGLGHWSESFSCWRKTN